MQDNELINIYGILPEKMTRTLLERIQPEQGLDKQARIGIKPNLVVPRPAADGATTHPEIVAAIIEYFQEKGFHNLVILEGSWVGDRTSSAFHRCGYDEIASRYQVPIYDLQQDKTVTKQSGSFEIEICQEAAKLDYLINVPVLKGHCQTGLTCALKNMKGCISDREKRRFHTMGLHRPIAALNTLIKQNLILVDGICGDLNFEEGGHPVAMNRMIAAQDPVLVDSYAAQLLGFDLADIPYIGLAEQMGVGSTDVDHAVITELNHDKQTPLRKPKPLQDRAYVRIIDEDQACSACYGSLIHALERLSERGQLRLSDGRICIGQAFKQKPKAALSANKQNIGIGNCTAGCPRYVKGCPPKAKDIVTFFEALDD